MTGAQGEVEREAVNFAFINAALVRSLNYLSALLLLIALNQIASPLHLLTAIYQALIAHDQGNLRTKTVHSEIIFALNPTNNVRNS